MTEKARLLVVDDEEVICQACRRIFSRQGFEVEVSTDACQGLDWAVHRDYGAVLLDIKMPRMDGIQFLERLRQAKPDLPVLIMTGYPSIPNATAAIRLGAADYVTKPFSPEEITRAVQRVMVASEAAPPAAAPEARSEAPGTDVFFLDEAWFRLESDGSACVGAVFPGLRGADIAAVTLPRIGEVVYQGLPLASVTAAGKPAMVAPSPVSGVIAAVNDELRSKPSLLATEPCSEGWIACVCTTRYEEEVGRCKLRRVLLANSHQASCAEQARALGALGCAVRSAATPAALLADLSDPEGAIVLLDAASLGADGPAIAGQVNVKAPAMRIVVAASPGDRWETEYRKHRIFYYAVTPFADNEIADILDAAFRAHEPVAAKADRPKGPSEAISSITITNRNGHKVQLLAAPGLLWRHEGLGGRIGRKLLEEAFPVVMTPGEASLTPASILKTAMGCDRLMVLLTKDVGLIPGSLARDTKPDFSVSPGDAAGKVTVLSVQPDAVGGMTGLEPRTIAALADHIVREMASY